MAAIHHQPGRQAVLGQGFCRFLHRLGVVVGAALAAAQHQVAIGVARGGHDGGVAVVVDAKEMVGPGGGLHGVDRRDRTAVGAVLEADRHRQA